MSHPPLGRARMISSSSPPSCFWNFGEVRGFPLSMHHDDKLFAVMPHSLKGPAMTAPW